MYKKNENKYLK